jgi:hypothetical protein
VKSSEFLRAVKDHPDWFYIIHYSSASLFEPDAQTGALSPRITAVVVRHYESGQTVSFATHTEAETLGISRDEIESHYDQIERQILNRFYEFVRDRREKYWVHWNMRNVTFGFEHLEHRYRVLNKKDPPSIPVEVRLNLNDLLKGIYGADYASDPKLTTLMNLNGGKVQGFLPGKAEAEAFKAKDFIRMNTSTIAKVGFLSYLISLAKKGKLKTESWGLLNFADRLLSSRTARLVALVGSVIGIAVGAVQVAVWVGYVRL